MVILKATLSLEEHKKDIKMTYRITLYHVGVNFVYILLLILYTYKYIYILILYAFYLEKW
jgi:hypothetical protein